MCMAPFGSTKSVAGVACPAASTGAPADHALPAAGARVAIRSPTPSVKNAMVGAVLLSRISELAPRSAKTAPGTLGGKPEAPGPGFATSTAHGPVVFSAYISAKVSLPPDVPQT